MTQDYKWQVRRTPSGRWRVSMPWSRGHRGVAWRWAPSEFWTWREAMAYVRGRLRWDDSQRAAGRIGYPGTARVRVHSGHQSIIMQAPVEYEVTPGSAPNTVGVRMRVYAPPKPWTGPRDLGPWPTPVAEPRRVPDWEA